MGQLEVEACLAAVQGATLEAVTVAPQVLITAGFFVGRAERPAKGS